MRAGYPGAVDKVSLQ